MAEKGLQDYLKEDPTLRTTVLAEEIEGKSNSLDDRALASIYRAYRGIMLGYSDVFEDDLK